MKSLVKRVLPTALHPWARSVSRKTLEHLTRIEHSFDRRMLSTEEFVGHLRRFGVTEGATVYLHSSIAQIGRRVPALRPFSLIELLKRLVGSEGNVLVPTFPFLGSQYYYAQQHPVFDVQRTPSMVGLLTEVFRRSEGVVRSWHPTHPIAAWGKRSRELVAHHHLGTAFGENSPVCKMQALNGLVVGLGVTPKNCFTVYHIAEELHPRSHAFHYSAQVFEMTIVDGGYRIPYQLTPLRPDRKRRYDEAERILLQEGILRYERIKGLEFSSASVRQFLERCKELIDANKFYPRDSSRNHR